MTRQDALRFVEDIVDTPAHTLTGKERLGDLELWDSLSSMVFIATVDKKLGLPLLGNQVARCQTVDDLLRLLGPAITDRAA